jgi:serine/threonine protein kinase
VDGPPNGSPSIPEGASNKDKKADDADCQPGDCKSIHVVPERMLFEVSVCDSTSFGGGCVSACPPGILEIRGLDMNFPYDYMLVDAKYFESPVLLKSEDDYKVILTDLFPSDWAISRRDYWYDLIPPFPNGASPTPTQGFKIHLSGTILSAKEILHRVAPIIASYNAQFKVIANAAILSYINEKNFSRVASAKFITIYPEQSAFKSIIRDLAKATEGIDGPYILSDKRYPESRIVFYRYGGFESVIEIDSDGSKHYKIRSPDGTIVNDDRTPYFYLPVWVKDPFPDTETARKKNDLLAGRYKVKTALKFSNSGGVYTAYDTRTKKRVVIKEARPYTNLSSGPLGQCDSVDIIRHEFEVLTRLKLCPHISQAIDLFQDWEHTFLVTEFVTGDTLSAVRARSSVSLLPFRGNLQTAKKFTRHFITIAANIIVGIKQIHDSGVVINDLSPSNIIVNATCDQFTFIDFEAAYIVGEQSALSYFIRNWNTVGMRRSHSGQKSDPTFKDDWFSLATTLQSLMLPVEPYFPLNERAREEIFDVLVRDSGVPALVSDVITALKAGDHEYASQILARGSMEPRRLPDAVRLMRSRSSTGCIARVRRVSEMCRNSVSAIARTMLQSYDVMRPDRIWPLDCRVFETHGVGLGLGAAGPIAFLAHVGSGVSEEVLDTWKVGIRNMMNMIPLGLNNGLAGISYVMHLAGQADESRIIFDRMLEVARDSNDPSYLDGVAGCVWVSLALLKGTGNSHYKEAAKLLIGLLCSLKRKRTESNYTWVSSAHPEWRGIAYGAMGIALVATQAADIFPDDPLFVELAVEAFDEDFEPSRKSLHWSHMGGRGIYSPYWLTGASGVASVAARMAVCTRDSRYLDIATSILRRNASHYCVLPAQVEGLSGIGEAFLDVFEVSKLEKYRTAAFEIAGSVLLYEIHDGSEVWYPGRYLVRRSMDYNYGASGIGSFFHRLLNGGKRLFHDL